MLRLYSTLAFLAVPLGASAQDDVLYTEAFLQFQPRIFEMTNGYLDTHCFDEHAAFKAHRGEDYLPHMHWHEIEAGFVRRARSDQDWMNLPVFTQPLSVTYDDAFNQSALLVYVSAVYVVDGLTFMGAFSERINDNEYLTITELEELRSKVIVSAELRDCIRNADTSSSNLVSAAIRQNVLTTLDGANDCIHFDVYVGRYLDEDLLPITTSQRSLVEARIFAEHESYLENIGQPPHCKSTG